MQAGWKRLVERMKMPSRHQSGNREKSRLSAFAFGQRTHCPLVSSGLAFLLDVEFLTMIA